MIYTLDQRVPQFKGDCWVADNASLIGLVVLEKDSSIWFNCVLRGDNEPITIGEGSNVQDGSVLHTDVGIPLTVGRGCTIGHMVMLHGCTIGDNTLIGIKSVVLNRAKIGKNSLVAANSLVTEGKEFPDGVLIMGSPAKVVRELTPQEIEFTTISSQHYVQNSKQYQTKLRRMEVGG